MLEGQIVLFPPMVQVGRAVKFPNPPATKDPLGGLKATPERTRPEPAAVALTETSRLGETGIPGEELSAPGVIPQVNNKRTVPRMTSRVAIPLPTVRVRVGPASWLEQVSSV